MKTPIVTIIEKKNTPTTELSIHRPAGLKPERTIEKHKINWRIVPHPNPSPNKIKWLLNFLMKNEPMVSPKMEFMTMPTVASSVAAGMKARRSTNTPP